MSLFHEYTAASGQHLSLEKCRFFVGSMTPRRVSDLSNFLAFISGRLPFIYLGVPVFKGKPKKAYLQQIANRIKVKLAFWKGSLLFIMGRVKVIKSVVHSMLIYSFHVYPWPISLLKMVDKWIRNFVWS